MSTNYKRNCPICNIPIIYGKYKYFWKARKNNSKCRKCFYQSLKGKPLSKERKLKIGKANEISLIGNIPWNKNKKNIYSESTKRKMRLSKLMRMKKLGIPPNMDIGAPEFFKQQNENGFKFIQNYPLSDIGYFVDGYDEDKHIICEFDTPHHKYKKKKDIIRQNNIIEYFEKNKHPLKEFIRIQADENGNVIESKCVYKGGF